MKQAAEEIALAAEESSPKALEEARIVSPRGRQQVVPLDWPVEYDGKTWSEITIRRATGRQVEAFLRAVMSLDDGDASRPPLPVIDCPTEVYDALDDDDRLRLEEAALPFLPRRLIQAAESSLDISEPTLEQ